MSQPAPADLLRQQAALFDASLSVQRHGLAILQGEMRALAAWMPGQLGPSQGSAKADAEVEAGFDNMPV